MTASSVLVVEDTEEIRTLVGTVLERAGMRVRAVTFLLPPMPVHEARDRWVRVT